MADVGGGQLNSLVIFRLSGQVFALPVENVREVVPYAWLSKPPRMPSFVDGVLNLAGAAVAVLRPDRLLGLPEATMGLEASILIMKGADAPMGLLVEHIDGVRPASAFQVMPVDRAQSFQGCVVGVLQGPTGTIHLMSWPRLLLEEESRRIGEFQRGMRDRLADLAQNL